MVIDGISITHLSALLFEVSRHLGVDIVKNCAGVSHRSTFHRSVRVCFNESVFNLTIDFTAERFVPGIVPFAGDRKVLTQSCDWITQREAICHPIRSVRSGIIRRGMRSNPQSDPLDHCGAEALTRPLSGPLRRCVHSEKIVAINPK